jgi:hypothetical protein
MLAFEGRKAKVIHSPKRFKKLDTRSKRMAANAKQGTYLGTTLTGFTAFVGGLYTGGGIGIVVAIVGAGLLLVSAGGFYKIKTV